MELVKKKSALEEKFYKLVTEVMPSTGLDLYQMTYNTSNSTLVIFIIDPETNSAVIEDCIKVDRAFSEPFEELSWIPENVRLEVSSPGMYRKFYGLDHFKQSIGQRVSVMLSKNVELDSSLSKKILSMNPLVGELEEVKEDKDIEIVLNIDDSKVVVSFSDIKKANLEPEL
jgi:ribosome maturation factor RimP